MAFGQTLKGLLETEIGIPVRIEEVRDVALIEEGSAIGPTRAMQTLDPSLTKPFAIWYETSDLRQRYSRDSDRHAARERVRTFLEGLL